MTERRRQQRSGVEPAQHSLSGPESILPHRREISSCTCSAASQVHGIVTRSSSGIMPDGVQHNPPTIQERVCLEITSLQPPIGFSRTQVLRRAKLRAFIIFNTFGTIPERRACM
jgi:hypothetical protein